MYINLLPPQEKKLLRRRYFSRVTLVGALLFAVIIIFSALSLLPPIIHLQYREINPARQSVTSLNIATASSSTVTMASITADINDLNSKIAIVNAVPQSATLSKQSVVLSRLVLALGRTTKVSGAKAIFSSFHFTENSGDEKAKIPPTYTVSLSGVAESRATLLALTKELRRTEGVMSVDNPISNYVPGKNLSFTIAITAL